MRLDPSALPAAPQRLLAGVIALLGLLVLSACAAQHRVQDPVAVEELEAPASNPHGAAYVLRPGDRLDVKFFYNPELNEAVTIRPDGRISLQLVGEQQAAGLTPMDLERQLEEAYSRDLKTPEVSVIVTDVNGYAVYVDGEVGTPGPVSIEGGMTVLEVISRAGGFSEDARRNDVILIRRMPNREPQVAVLNLDAAINGSDLAQDVRLQPHDIVYVPRTAIADLNQFMAQYFRNNLPLPFSFGYAL